MLNATWSFTRNTANQIRTEAQTNGAYGWDGHVNASRSYTANGLNQYTSAGSASFCHDANGNLTADGTSVFLYDVENRLVEMRAQGVVNANCAALAYTGQLRAKLRYDPLERLHELGDGQSNLSRFLDDRDALVAA